MGAAILLCLKSGHIYLRLNFRATTHQVIQYGHSSECLSRLFVQTLHLTFSLGLK